MIVGVRGCAREERGTGLASLGARTFNRGDAESGSPATARACSRHDSGTPPTDPLIVLRDSLFGIATERKFRRAARPSPTAV